MYYFWHIFEYQKDNLSFFPGPKDFVGISGPDEIIRVVKENPRLGFLYLSPNVARSSVLSHYYNLK